MCTSYVKFNCMWTSIKCAYKYLFFYELRAEKYPMESSKKGSD